MPSAEDSDAAARTGRRALGHGRGDEAAAAARRPVVLNRSELANMNRLIANKMRGDIEAALEITDENSVRNLDAAASR
jgi:hypothetical protein